MQDRYLRAREVLKATGLSRSTIWRLEKYGQFPTRRRIARHAVGWLESEIVSWQVSREKAV